jgi:alpha-ketoglutarate-dependent 2,4-dichlorophenoxyacetate dioxygenase
MRAAYDGLDARTKVEIEDPVCEHSLIFSRAAIGMVDLTPEEIAAFKPVRQRLVRVHPVTGRKSLFLSSHAAAIVGWDNRATMHRGRRFDRNEVRDVRRTTLAGHAPIVEQATPDLPAS